jgi:pilus assembly protein CpaC
MEALVANAEIADVVPLTDRSIYIVGKKIGMTRITVLDDAKHLLGVIEVEVSFDVRALREELARNIRGADFRLSTANGRIVLAGMVPDSMALAKAAEITEQFAPKSFVNMLTVRAAQQVLLEVRFVEAQRTAARDLGFSWSVQGSRLSIATGIGGLPSGNVPFGTFVARILDGGVTADVLIEALEKRGVARRLAEPNLVTLSGDTANFLAGGEFPFPVAAELNRITVEFKKFGVGLAFTPTVLANGQINLKIEPEVSDLDPVNTIQIANTAIPSLIVRRASTTVELRDGQSFAIAGLLQSAHSKDDRQLPWLGTVPVLGTLFSSMSYKKSESDLVIIVTPRLVRPAVPGQKLMVPTEDRIASNDRDYFLRRRQEVLKAPGYGHILEAGNGWEPRTTSEIGNGPAK